MMSPKAIPLDDAGVKQAIARDELGQARAPFGGRPKSPLFVYESISDEALPIADVEELVAKYCSWSVPVEFVRDSYAEHIELALEGAGAAVDYLARRFAGEPAPSTCATGPRTVSNMAVEPYSNLIADLMAYYKLPEFF